MQRPPSLLLAALAALAVAGVAVAATYRWVDAQGVVHYSDTPQPGAQQIQLPPAQTYHAVPVPAVQPHSDAPPPAAYQSCVIAQPTAGQSLFAPELVRISVQLQPSLRPGDVLTVTLDGAALMPVSESEVAFEASQVDRGEHTVNAVVHDGGGKVACSAAAVTFYVQRTSLLGPSAPARH